MSVNLGSSCIITAWSGRLSARCSILPSILFSDSMNRSVAEHIQLPFNRSLVVAGMVSSSRLASWKGLS